MSFLNQRSEEVALQKPGAPSRTASLSSNNHLIYTMLYGLTFVRVSHSFLIKNFVRPQPPSSEISIFCESQFIHVHLNGYQVKNYIWLSDIMISLFQFRPTGEVLRVAA